RPARMLRDRGHPIPCASDACPAGGYPAARLPGRKAAWPTSGRPGATPDKRAAPDDRAGRFCSAPVMKPAWARVLDVRAYDSFEAMLDHEDMRATGGKLGESRDELLRATGDIYPPEKEALGVLAIEIERVEQ